jgi:hypothetical protein
LRRLLVPALVALAALGAPPVAWARRPIPDTSAAVHVWDDQLPDSMTDAQVRFVARHVDGTQKISLQTADRLRAVNPGFLVLHYRLGIGDGPVPFRIGAEWASDYGSVTRHESWFWHEDGRRVFQSQWGWYLMNPDSGWRSYWARRVLYEASLLGDDGVDRADRSLDALRGAAPARQVVVHPQRRLVDHHARSHELRDPRRRDDRGLRRRWAGELLRAR